MVSHDPIFLSPLLQSYPTWRRFADPAPHQSDTILNFDKADLNEPIRDTSHPVVASLPQTSGIFPSPAQCKEAVSRMAFALSQTVWPRALIT